MNNCLNDKDHYVNLLNNLKNIAKNYTIAITETDSKELLDSLLNEYNNIIDMQHETYHIMKDNNWYSVKDADLIDIEEAYNNLATDFEEIGDNN